MCSGDFIVENRSNFDSKSDTTIRCDMVWILEGSWNDLGWILVPRGTPVPREISRISEIRKNQGGSAPIRND